MSQRLPPTVRRYPRGCPLGRWAGATRAALITILSAAQQCGKARLSSLKLAADDDEARAFCHIPETAFTGPVSERNRTATSYPGSVRTRFSNGKPQTHCYAALRLYCAIIHGEATSRVGADSDRYSFTIKGLHFADLTGPPLS
jgi:hypothetical protein